jgi:N-carbamoylputrescine amidase
MKLGLVQQTANPAGVDALAHAVRLVHTAADRGAEVIVLPELFRWPYPAQAMAPEQFRFAEPLEGPTAAAMRAVAAERGVVIVASMFEERAPGLGFNTALVIGTAGETLGVYRKAHIPDDPLYYEKFLFTPGDTPCGVFDTPFGRLGVLVCWDQWYPEAARLAAMQGAEVLVYPTAIGTIEEEGPEEHARQCDAWQTVQRGHAIANGVFVAAVNRIGREGELDFWGESFAVGPQGEWLWRAADAVDAVAVVDCPRERLGEVRRMWPFFRDRRIDLYGALTKRWDT